MQNQSGTDMAACIEIIIAVVTHRRVVGMSRDAIVLIFAFCFVVVSSSANCFRFVVVFLHVRFSFSFLYF